MADDLRITPDELWMRMKAGENFTVLDARNPQAWGESNQVLPNAVRVTHDDLDQALARLPKDKPVVAYCT